MAGRLREGEDYYLEGGFLVFTEAYHIKRGYCCGSGCRHCPYWPRHSGSRVLRREVAEGGAEATPGPEQTEPPGPG